MIDIKADKPSSADKQTALKFQTIGNRAMSAFLKALPLFAALVAAPAIAAEPDAHAGHHPEGAASAPAAGPSARPSGSPASAAPDRMQERNKQMQTMMEQAQKAKTPEERQKLMAEHMKLMQEQMTAMHGMMGTGGMMAQPQAGAAPAPNTPQMGMMQQRMNMMQQMMEQQQLMMKPAG